MTTLRVFRTHDAETRYRAIYNKRVQDWPVHCEELDLHTRFGMTHVIASGPVDARQRCRAEPSFSGLRR